MCRFTDYKTAHPSSHQSCNIRCRYEFSSTISLLHLHLTRLYYAAPLDIDSHNERFRDISGRCGVHCIYCCAFGDNPSSCTLLSPTFCSNLIPSQCFFVGSFRLLFHPLRNYPGPLFGRLTNAYAGYFSIKKSFHIVTYQNFQKYGNRPKYRVRVMY